MTTGIDKHTPAVTIIGTGSHLPDRVLTNADLEKMVETTDEWIRTRTGIHSRHIARDGEGCCDLAAKAAQNAMGAAGVKPEEVDLLVMGTFTPDIHLPSGACLVQDKIGINRAFCFDVVAACSGFIYGLETARSLMMANHYNTAIVIGAEKLSAVTDWTDRGTCVLFGDGAGAAVLRKTNGELGRGFLSSVMGSDGSLAGLLCIPGMGSKNPIDKQQLDDRKIYIKMMGNEVFKHAVRCMFEAGKEALKRAGLTMDDVDLVIPHQANIRIIEALASRLTDSRDKVFVNVDKVGNMSAASIPVALDQAVRAGRLKKGNKVLFVAFGAGFTWAASVMEWGY
jgi:3-oxoacyl-[acyl-carrier-protein] synthase-3